MSIISLIILFHNDRTEEQRDPLCEIQPSQVTVRQIDVRSNTPIFSPCDIEPSQAAVRQIDELDECQSSSLMLPAFPYPTEIDVNIFHTFYVIAQLLFL